MPTPLPDVSQIHPIGDRLLVRRYTKPETIRGIIVPEKFRTDTTLTLWEVVAVAPKALAQLGDDALAADEIVITPGRRGMFVNELLPTFDPDYAFIRARDISKVIRWQ